MEFTTLLVNPYTLLGVLGYWELEKERQGGGTAAWVKLVAQLLASVSLQSR